MSSLFNSYLVYLGIDLVHFFSGRLAGLCAHAAVHDAPLLPRARHVCRGSLPCNLGHPGALERPPAARPTGHAQLHSGALHGEHPSLSEDILECANLHIDVRNDAIINKICWVAVAEALISNQVNQCVVIAAVCFCAVISVKVHLHARISSMHTAVWFLASALYGIAVVSDCFHVDAACSRYGGPAVSRRALSAARP